MVLGAWGALVPFFGHSFSYGFTPDNTWTWTAARGWLEVLPGGAAFLGGALLTVAGTRVSAMLGGWLAACAGAWYVVALIITPWWSAGNIGVPSGTPSHGVWEQLGMFYGLGAVIIFLAALGLGRASVMGVRDVAAAESRREVIDLTPSSGNAPTTAAEPGASEPARPATTTTTATPAGTRTR
jgi:hypothetical protein